MLTLHRKECIPPGWDPGTAKNERNSYKVWTSFLKKIVVSKYKAVTL